MFVSSCSHFLLSLTVDALCVNVANLRVRLRRLRGPVVCGGSVCSLTNCCIRSVPIVVMFRRSSIVFESSGRLSFHSMLHSCLCVRYLK